MVSREDKELLLGQRGAILWFTGVGNRGHVDVGCRSSTIEDLRFEYFSFEMLLGGEGGPGIGLPSSNLTWDC